MFVYSMASSTNQENNTSTASSTKQEKDTPTPPSAATSHCTLFPTVNDVAAIVSGRQGDTNCPVLQSVTAPF